MTARCYLTALIGSLATLLIAWPFLRWCARSGR